MSRDAGDARIDVAVVAYRSRERVLRCLASLDRAAHDLPIAVTVVDNDSRDGTPEAIAERFPAVRVLAPGENLGFARATNLAAAAGSAPFVLALNPDTELPPRALPALLAIFDSRPDVAIVGPKLVRDDGSFDHASRRAFPTVLGAVGHLSGIGRRLRGGPLSQYRAPGIDAGKVDAVNGAFMLMRRDVFDSCGGFDERYWMYMEDLDLSYRVARAGWSTWYEPSVEVLHAKGASAGRVRSARLERAFYGGMARFYRSHYAPERPAPANLVVYAGIGAWLSVRLALLPLRRIAARSSDRAAGT